MFGSRFREGTRTFRVRVRADISLPIDHGAKARPKQDFGGVGVKYFEGEGVADGVGEANKVPKAFTG